jgi:hypothetical protein
MVELNPQFEEGEARPAAPSGDDGSAAVVVAQPAQPSADLPQDGSHQQQTPPPAATESNADGVKFVSDVLQKATSARWPMYIRNVKQLLRAADSSFDERRYGFGGLMDLLRACQREALMRLERDRRGGLRVFPGAALQRPADVQAPNVSGLPQRDEGTEADMDEGGGQPFAPIEADAEPPEVNGNVIDSTAELLGRAKPRKPRAKAPAPMVTRKASRSTGTAAPRKPAARRTKSKKAAADSGDDKS